MALAMPQTVISEEQRAVLERWVNAQRTPQSVAQRVRIMLLAGTGESNSAIGRGRKPTIAAATIKAIEHATRQTTPPGQTHWSCRTARAQGVHRTAHLGRSRPAASPCPHLQAV